MPHCTQPWSPPVKGVLKGTVDLISKVVLAPAGWRSSSTHSCATSSLQGKAPGVQHGRPT